MVLSNETIEIDNQPAQKLHYALFWVIARKAKIPIGNKTLVTRINKMFANSLAKLKPKNFHFCSKTYQLSKMQIITTIIFQEEQQMSVKFQRFCLKTEKNVPTTKTQYYLPSCCSVSYNLRLNLLDKKLPSFRGSSS